MSSAYHTPVMLGEALEWLDLAPGKTVVDTTLGAAGHSIKIAEALGPGGLLIGIDQDSDAIAEAGMRLESVHGARVHLAQLRFDNIAEAVRGAGESGIDGVLFDLGVSSHMLDDPSRGFTFREQNAPLDMRMARDQGGQTAADLLNSLEAGELTRIFRDYADENWAARIAKFIVERRGAEPYQVAGQLVETINAAVPAGARNSDGIHPSTRVFQALRIAVNDEFEVLKRALSEAAKLLRPEGRLVTIAYHSGEDRIVKQFMAHESGKRHCICPPRQPVCTCGAGSQGELEILAKKPIAPSQAEIERNPRARSAKLRVARKRTA